MAVNTSETKFIVFRTRGMRVDPAECSTTMKLELKRILILFTLLHVYIMMEKKLVLNY
jgi:hypothetical protein